MLIETFKSYLKNRKNGDVFEEEPIVVLKKETGDYTILKYPTCVVHIEEYRNGEGTRMIRFQYLYENDFSRYQSVIEKQDLLGAYGAS